MSQFQAERAYSWKCSEISCWLRVPVTGGVAEHEAGESWGRSASYLLGCFHHATLGNSAVCAGMHQHLTVFTALLFLWPFCLALNCARSPFSFKGQLYSRFLWQFSHTFCELWRTALVGDSQSTSICVWSVTRDRAQGLWRLCRAV